jgi:hypothetical protein
MQLIEVDTLLTLSNGSHNVIVIAYTHTDFVTLIICRINACYSLNLKCPQKAHLLKTWSQAHVTVGMWWKL